METRAPTEGGDELLLRWHKLRDSFAATTPLIQNLVDNRGAPAAADNMASQMDGQPERPALRP
jgi:hypothetical protein